MAKTNDPGLGTKYNQKINRMINSDGSYNIVKIGGIRGFKDLYKYLVDVSWWQFIFISFLSYLIVNILFASLYSFCSIQDFTNYNVNFPKFINAFLFSSQTFTGLGYGNIAPIGLIANVIATIEAFAGLMSIALITGLLYGRFSKPSTKILFSKNILIAPFQDSTALMFKMVNQRDSLLLNAHVKTMFILDKGEGTESNNKEYHVLDLQLDTIHFFPLTWTIVHKIDKDSPLYNLNVSQLVRRSAEVIVLFE